MTVRQTLAVAGAACTLIGGAAAGRQALVSSAIAEDHQNARLDDHDRVIKQVVEEQSKQRNAQERIDGNALSACRKLSRVLHEPDDCKAPPVRPE